MTWLTWRQFRTQALAVFGGLAVLAVATVITGLQLRQWSAGCVAPADCTGLAEAGVSRFKWLEILLRGGLLVLPAVTGMFFGAPLVARELETGTHRMVWTQSVSRARWLAVKVLVVGAATVLASGLLSWMTTWWFGPVDAAEIDKFVDSTFGTRDVAPMGYAAFAFAVGLTAGLLFRRVMPAMATTLVVFIAVRMVVQMIVRTRYLTPLRASGLLDPLARGDSLKGGALIPPGSWVFGSQIFDASGNPAPNPLRFTPNDPCSATQSCLKGYTLHIEYQPWSRYWAFQWTEAGLFLAIALLLVAFCFWWINGHRLPGTGPRLASQAAPRVHDERTGQQGAAETKRPRLTGVDR